MLENQINWSKINLLVKNSIRTSSDVNDHKKCKSANFLTAKHLDQIRIKKDKPGTNH